MSYVYIYVYIYGVQKVDVLPSIFVHVGSIGNRIYINIYMYRRRQPYIYKYIYIQTSRAHPLWLWRNFAYCTIYSAAATYIIDNILCCCNISFIWRSLHCTVWEGCLSIP